MGVGLGNSMGPAYHKGVPCPWGSLKIPLIGTVDHYNHGNLSGAPPQSYPPQEIAGPIKGLLTIGFP